MWIAEATYADGTRVKRCFAADPDLTEAEDQYGIECWLIERNGNHGICTWYSVIWVNI